MAIPETTTDQVWSSERDAPAGYRLGDPIALEDLLALPPDGRRYVRDERGRLQLMSPDDTFSHRRPLGRLGWQLARAVEPRLGVFSEPGLALPVLVKLDGSPVPSSRLGPRRLEPDLAVFEPHLPDVLGPPAPDLRAQGLHLVVEVLSDDTFRNDLGLGEADAVDRWRSYLLSGVPELWLVNVGVEAPCPLPPRSGLFLRNAGDAWVPLDVDEPALAGGEVHGLRPLLRGRVRSLTGATFDLEAYWAEVERWGATF